MYAHITVKFGIEKHIPQVHYSMPNFTQSVKGVGTGALKYSKFSEI